jgi:hypothetical protein
MAWLNSLNENKLGRLLKLSVVATATVVIGACNVGKTDTIEGGTSTGGTSKSGCTGSYVGGFTMPEQAVRIENRNRSLNDRGIAVTGNDDIDNANAGGGPPDGGIWMSGGFQFETDGNCNIIKSEVNIFAYTGYGVDGTINKDGTFDLVWSGNGSQGGFVGNIDSNNNIAGKFNHPAPDTYVHGVLGGKFTPNGKI